MRKWLITCLIIMTILSLSACRNKEKEMKDLSFFDKKYEFTGYDETTQTYTYKNEQIIIEIKETINEKGRILNFSYNNESYEILSNGYDSFTIYYSDGTYFTLSGTPKNYRSPINEFNNVNNLFHENPNDKVDFISKTKMIVLGSILIVIGFLSFKAPYFMFKLQHIFIRWQYRDLEPSDVYISFTKWSGLVGAIIGIVLVVFNL